MAYAQNTSVTPGRSREEIERTLRRYGADGFMYGWENNQARIAFKLRERTYRFDIALPPQEKFRFTETGRERADAAIQKAQEQAIKQRWRALALVIKAKLEAVETGISSIEEEFFTRLVLGNGKTVFEEAKPKLDQIGMKGIGLLEAGGDGP